MSHRPRRAARLSQAVILSPLSCVAFMAVIPAQIPFMLSSFLRELAGLCMFEHPLHVKVEFSL